MILPAVLGLPADGLRMADSSPTSSRMPSRGWYS